MLGCALFPLWNDPSSLPYTDWVDEIYRNGLEHSYNLSLSGGSGKIRYYLAGAYERENGTQVDNWWESISARVNVDYAVNRAVTVGTRVYFARLRENPYTMSFPWVSIPVMTVTDPDGSWSAIPDGIDTSAGNPRADIGLHHYKSSDLVGNADLYMDWNIVDGLKFNVTGAAHFGGGYDDNYTEANDLGRSPTTDSYYKYQNYSEEYTLTTTLSYGKVFGGRHDFNVMAGFEVKNANYAFTGATATGFPISDPESFALSTIDDMTASGTLSHDRFMSFFGRLTYSYAGRYLFTANFRRDGSPKFGPSHRWGNFPSFSAGWKISEEPFFKNWAQNWLTSLKPRVSWGILGNDTALDSYSYLSSFRNVALHSFDGASDVAGYNNPKVINEDIKWETVEDINVGLDVGFFKNKLTGTFEYYVKNTYDMLFQKSYPNYSGYPSGAQIWSNVGSMRSEGFEFNIQYNDKFGDFWLSAQATFTTFKVKMTELTGDGEPLYGANGRTRTEVGEEPGYFYGYVADGLFQNRTELNAHTDEHGNFLQPYAKEGDIRFLDLNEDGVLDAKDRTKIGSPWADFTAGLNLTLGYRNIDLTASFYASVGNDLVNQNISELYNGVWKTNKVSGLLNRAWHGEGTSNYIPRLTQDDNNENFTKFSSFYIEDGSFLLYIAGQNLFTITKYSGVDPEVAGSVLSFGFGGYDYPVQRTLIIGANLNF